MKSPKFKIGTILNSPKMVVGRVRPAYSSVVIKCPYRLNAMALDPSLIAINDSKIYTPGEIVFPIQLYRIVLVRIRKDSRINVLPGCSRPQLAVHAARLMKRALNTKNGFDISIKEEVNLNHYGFGSSSGLISSIAIAINEIYGKPIKNSDLILYLAQNHGEEIDGNSTELQHVQCIGGAAAASLVKAGFIVISGESKIIAKMNISKDLKVVIGIPRNYNPRDSTELIKQEVKNIKKFIETGKKWGTQVAYQLIHFTLPAMLVGDLKSASKVIYNYRFLYGSIENCSFAYPLVVGIARRIKKLFLDPKVYTLSLSSVGPAFFAITSDEKKCIKEFSKAGLDCIITKVHNRGYRVLSKL